MAKDGLTGQAQPFGTVCTETGFLLESEGYPYKGNKGSVVAELTDFMNHYF